MKFLVLLTLCVVAVAAGYAPAIGVQVQPAVVVPAINPAAHAVLPGAHAVLPGAQVGLGGALIRHARGAVILPVLKPVIRPVVPIIPIVRPNPHYG